MTDFKSVANAVGYHGKVFIRGLVRTIYGAATSGLIGLAVYGLMMIPKEGGYTAVCEFVGALATICLAGSCIYANGGGKRRKGGFER